MSFAEEVERRRTFAIISHPDAGKTTLTEKLIYHGGVIHKTGEVKAKEGRKSATSDWMEMEKEKGISISSSVMQFDHNGLRVNLLDTPGHKDFSEDTYRVLTAVDSAVMLIDVAKGVEERTKKLYEVCSYRKIPIFTFVNKLDREGKGSLELIDEIENTLKMQCYPVTWPIGIGDLFRGVYDRFNKRFYIYDQSREDVHDFKIVETDDPTHPDVVGNLPQDFIDQLVEDLELLDGALPPFEVEKFLSGEISPVTFGSAKQNFGVDIFLDFFTKYAPAPGARKLKSGEEMEPKDNNFTGFVFKIQANMNKKHRDRMAFIRVCSGQFERGMKVHHTRLNREIRIAHSASHVAEDGETVDDAYAGDILGVNDTGNFQIGDSICTKGKVEFEAIPRFAPELFAHLRVKDALKRTKLQKGMNAMAQEGTIQLFYDPFLGHQDPIVGVVGELQFDVLLRRLQDEYGLDAKLERLPFSVARWPRLNDEATDQLKGTFTIYKDMYEQPVILLNQEWDLNWAQRENPDIEFALSIRPARD